MKYPRTMHLPWSLGRTKDDRVLTSTSAFDGRGGLSVYTMVGALVDRLLDVKLTLSRDD